MDLKLENKNDFELALEELIISVITEIYKTLKAENLIEIKTCNAEDDPDFYQTNKGTVESNTATNYYHTTGKNMENSTGNAIKNNSYSDNYGIMEGDFINNDRSIIQKPVLTNYTGRYYSNVGKYYVHWTKVK